MICPLYDFCKIACNDYRCGQNYHNCQHMRKLKGWIKELIESTLEDLE